MINYFYFSTVNISLIIHAACQQGLRVSVRSAGGSLFTPSLRVAFSLLRRRSVSAKLTDGNQRVLAWSQSTAAATPLINYLKAFCF